MSELDEFPIEVEDGVEAALDKVVSSNTNSHSRIRFLVNMVFVLIVASLYPGEPTIEPTEECSLAQAERCQMLQGICSPAFDTMTPMQFSPQGTQICAVERPQLCRMCAGALVGYEMVYFERLVHYGPWWFGLPGWIAGFFQLDPDERADT